jgi:hypothetical protein
MVSCLELRQARRHLREVLELRRAFYSGIARVQRSAARSYFGDPPSVAPDSLRLPRRRDGRSEWAGA